MSPGSTYYCCKIPGLQHAASMILMLPCRIMQVQILLHDSCMGLRPDISCVAGRRHLPPMPLAPPTAQLHCSITT